MIKKAVEFLRQKEAIAAPTETVYGLFADATSDSAVQKIYRIKGRPSCNPLIVHVAGIEMAQSIVDIPIEIYEVLDHFWNIKKKPLTVVLKISSNKIPISKFVTAGLSTVAIRSPNHPIFSEIMSLFNGPLAAPSANTSQSVSPTTYKMVKESLGQKVQIIIDGGKCDIGIESTILDMTQEPYSILRHGGVPREMIESFLGYKVSTQEGKIKAPGMMKRHYAPSIPIRINAAFPLENEAFIAFGKTDIKFDFNLSESEDLDEAGKNLFCAIKALDNPKKYSGIAVMPIPDLGIGEGINDRLNRASSFL
jgi:L-threonylcarbamoyladenylate synthase